MNLEAQSGTIHAATRNQEFTLCQPKGWKGWRTFTTTAKAPTCKRCLASIDRDRDEAQAHEWVMSAQAKRVERAERAAKTEQYKAWRQFDQYATREDQVAADEAAAYEYDGRYFSSRINTALYDLVQEGWSSRETGELGCPDGFVSLVDLTVTDVAEIPAGWLADWQITDPSALAGIWLVITPIDGPTVTYTYATREEADRVFDNYEARFVRWCRQAEHDQADADEAKAARMPIGPRGEVATRQPNRVGNGVSRAWRRTINGTHYAFTVVNMPSGEVRLFVRVYNGYCADDPDFGMRFSCAWSPVKYIRFPGRVETAARILEA